MPKTTLIIRWRDRRQRRRRRSGYLSRQLLGIAALTAAAGLLILSIVGALGGMATYAYFTRQVPEYDELIANWKLAAGSPGTTTLILAWQGDDREHPIPIYEITDPLDQDREWLALDQIPEGLVDATVAFEEPEYWEEPGFDLVDIGRTLYQHFAGEEPTGYRDPLVQRIVTDGLKAGETQARQREALSRGAFRDLIQTLLWTHRVSRIYDKEQILAWYFNTAFYGNLAYGIEAASHVYFNKPVADLSLAEAAMLAAIPTSPEHNPIDDPDTARSRQEQVLMAMADTGVINRDILAAAMFTPVEATPGREERLDVIAPHFSLYVRRELEARFGPQLLLNGGLRVYTTLDLEIQRQAECVARAHINRLSGHIGADLPADERDSCMALQFLQPLPEVDSGKDFGATNAAVVVMDAETAGIRAMVGSLNYWEEGGGYSFNIAADGQRQPGTLLKPFVYLTALSQGYTAATMVLDLETSFEDAADNVFTPRNEDGQFHGPMRLREALGNDYHVPAVQVLSWVGMDKVLRTAHSLGVTGLDEPPNSYGLSLPLGGGDVTLLDMVYAYNVVNNMGVMLGQPTLADGSKAGGRPFDPVAILRVENSEGDVLYEYNPAGRREILTPQLAYLMNDMLSDRSARCAAFGCPNVLELPNNRPAAGVTGTTNDYRDAWTIGYTPQLVAGVWVGNSDYSDTEQLPGIKGAAPIWQALMTWAMQEESVALWTQPPELVEMAVCNISGLLSTPYCPTVSELFISGTQPTVQDTIYREYAINRETNRLATIFTPPDLVEHKIFQVYSGRAADWALDRGLEKPPAEYDTITTSRGDSEDASISWPTPFASIRNRVDIKGTASGEAFDSYRLAYFEGLTPENLQDIANSVTEKKEEESLGSWDVSNLDGLYTLLLTVFREDGSFDEVSTPITVDNIPPAVDIIFPLPNQRVSTSALRLGIQADVDDNIKVRQVSFYLDGADAPFATVNTPPFSAQWRIRGSGCHTLMAVAADAAGNETESQAVPFCLVEEE